MVDDTVSDVAGSPEENVASTSNSYSVKGTSPVTSHDVDGGVAVHVELPGDEVTVYPVTVPELGAVQLTVADVEPGVICTLFGARSTRAVKVEVANRSVPELEKAPLRSFHEPLAAPTSPQFWEYSTK